MRLPRIIAAVLPCALLLCLLSCGSDFSPPKLETSGELGSPLGQIIDVDVSLPNFQVPGVPGRGVELVLRLDIDDDAGTLLTGQFEIESAVAAGQLVTAIDLSDGSVEIRRDGSSWESSRLGPLVLEGAIFDLFLEGETQDDGWIIVGEAIETQTGLGGSFGAWRRHRFLVTTTDFFSDSGRISEVSWVRDQFIQVREGLELVSSDSVLVLDDAILFALNRFGFDNLQRLNPTADYLSSWQASVGTGANPHDAAALDEDRWALSRYEPPFNDLLIFNPEDGSAIDSVDLTPWAQNPDATPRADQIHSISGDLWVTLQDIDRTFTRYEAGRLLQVSGQTLEVLRVIDLPGKNPTGLLRTRDDSLAHKLAVVMSGIFPGLVPQELSGGILFVDVQTGEASAELSLDDDRVAGNLGPAVWPRADTLYAVVSDAGFQNRLIAFDPNSDTVREVAISGGFIPSIAASRGLLLAVPNRTGGATELCLYRIPASPTGDEALLGCGNTALPPFSVLALD